jgi:sugar lactone lactonase YvrE
MIYSQTPCRLGEGPLWHPTRGSLLWFDILSKRLHERATETGTEQHWDFDEHASAAGWVDAETLLLATQSGLYRFSLTTGERTLLVPLEADNDNPTTRSNDGRADPYGGFWIGTMGLKAESKAGAIYRYYKGTLRKLVSDITITNAICFAPDGKTAYFADTPEQRIQSVTLDEEGWPIGAPRTFVDLAEEGLNPDGAVVDAEGNLWSAQWGTSRVACYGPDGNFLRAVSLPASQITCPAFGGADGSDLFVTSSADVVDEADGGKTFVIPGVARGQQEHRVILPA